MLTRSSPSDTLDTKNVVLTNFVYQGGDDCIAIKPRTYNFYARNVTCHSGNGIAVGSLGQYLEDSTVDNVIIDQATIIKGGAQNSIGNGAYIKTWVGELVSGGDRDYESDYQPRGGGKSISSCSARVISPAFQYTPR